MVLPHPGLLKASEFLAAVLAGKVTDQKGPVRQVKAQLSSAKPQFSCHLLKECHHRF